jgi:hypothetical protein
MKAAKARRKPRGFRVIVVDQHTLWWRFTPGAHNSELVMVPPGVPGTRCLVRMPSWRDPWYHAHVFVIDAQPRIQFPTDNTPATITPQFVASAATWALQNGWQPLIPAPPFVVVFDQSFSRATNN